MLRRCERLFEDLRLDEEDIAFVEERLFDLEEASPELTDQLYDLLVILKAAKRRTLDVMRVIDARERALDALFRLADAIDTREKK